MHRITLICSAHRENGLCNAAELLRILRAIEPEVVFQEVRPSEFDFLYKRGSVEAHAIARYREFKSSQWVPVDRYDIPANLLAEIKEELDYVFDYVGQASPEYRLLNEENDDSVRQRGFRYLNSVACASVNTRMSEIEDMAIMGTGNEDLIGGLGKWRHFVQSREVEMVRNIYNYCRENVFETGALLVGAAHKAAIVSEVKKYSGTEADLINWNFDYGGQIP
jgi:hypothetical protein